MFSVHTPVVSSLAIRLSEFATAAILNVSGERIQMAYHLQLELMMRCVEVFPRRATRVVYKTPAVAHDDMVNEALSDLEKETCTMRTSYQS